MMIRTKKYRLSSSKYIKMGFLNAIYQQWWIWGLLVIGGATSFYFKYYISGAVTLGLLLLYFVFWWVQFYGVTKVEQNQLMFESLFYEISNQRLVMFLNTKQGMPIDWKQITSAKKKKDHFILFLSLAQFIYLPYNIFRGPQEVQMITVLLKNKRLLR